MAISVPHNLGADEARNRIKCLSETLVRENQGKISEMQESWVDHAARFSFRILGFSVEGNLHVEESHVRLEGKFPLAGLPFKKGIEKDIKNTARKLMGNPT
jgi:hypothetical protein